MILLFWMCNGAFNVADDGSTDHYMAFFSRVISSDWTLFQSRRPTSI